jgi:outer membrane receptor for ferrienterochelin and colicin
MVLLANQKLSCNLSLQYSGTAQQEPLGVHEIEIDLYKQEEGSYLAELDIPDLEDTYHYTLTTELVAGVECLTDYDGGFNLPAEVIALVEAQGIVVSEDFK